MTFSVAAASPVVDDLCAPRRIYSVGYEGFEVKGFVDRLVAAKVYLVVDVRLTPVSRKRGFSGKSLRGALEQVGIAYRHDAQLGNPQDNREAFRRGNSEDARRRMRSLLSNGAGGALSRLVADARNGRVAVLCVERSRLRCHRDVITDMVKELDPTIEVVQIL